VVVRLSTTLANNAVQPTAARVMMSAAAADGSR